MQTGGIKQEAYKLLNQLPDQATWDDLMQKIYVRQAIEAGINDSDEGRTMDVKDVLFQEKVHNDFPRCKKRVDGDLKILKK